MSEEHSKDSVVERYWQVGLIAFGLAFLTLLVSFHPFW